MINFEDFFKVSEKCLRMIGLNIYPKIAVTKREIKEEMLKKLNLWINIMNMTVGILGCVLYIHEQNGNLTQTGATWTLIFLLIISGSKTIHLSLKMNDVLALKDRICIVFKVSQFVHYDKRNLRISNIMSITYLFCIHGTGLIFNIMPIFHNLVNIVNGSDHWDYILPHPVSFYISHDSQLPYIVIYAWMFMISITIKYYMVSNEILFDILLVSLSTEFDNLGDNLEEFDYENEIAEEFKKLVNRHNELQLLQTIVWFLMRYSLILCW